MIKCVFLKQFDTPLNKIAQRKKKCIIKSMIRWKIAWKFKKVFWILV